MPDARSRALVHVRAMVFVAGLALWSCGHTTGAPSVTVSEAPTASTPSPPGVSRSPGVASAIVLIVMENTEYPDVVGSPDAPFIGETLIPRGTLFTNYHAVAHPSLPNYLAMTSGSTHAKDGTDAIAPGEIAGENLFHQLAHAGISWRAFEETMPAPCDRSVTAGTAPGEYALKHDPAMAYANVADTSLCRNVVPLSEMDPSRLPAFSFVTPNECNDMHSCPVASGDTWLRDHVPPLLGAGATVLITFDEGSTDVGGGGHVLTVEVGPGTSRGTRVTAAFGHLSLLAGLEERFGLPRLGDARGAAPLPI